MIRAAKPSDIPEILDLYKAGLDEIGLEWKESFLLKKVVNSYHLAPCFLLEIDGKIQGMAGLTSVVVSHNGEPSLADYMFFVRLEHRNIATLGELVEAAKDFADEYGLPLRLDFISRNDEKIRKRLLERHGFRVVSIAGVYNER